MFLVTQSTLLLAVIPLLLLLSTSTLSIAIMSASTPKLKLSYFDIEGKAEPTRLALILSKTPFEDDRVSFADWAALKPQTPMGQLPVLTIDDGPMRTQSNAMLRWVGATFSKTLYPTERLLDVEEAMGVVEDLQQDLAPALYMAMRPVNYGFPEDYGKTEEGQKRIKALRETFVKEKLPKHLARLETLLQAHGGKWLVKGDEPTVADCLAVPTLRNLTRGHIDHIDTACLDAHPVIVQYIKNFCALEGVKGRYNNGIR